MAMDNAETDNPIGNTKQDDIQFTVVTLNVRGLNQYKKRSSIIQWIKSNNVDIVFCKRHSSPMMLKMR